MNLYPLLALALSAAPGRAAAQDWGPPPEPPSRELMRALKGYEERFRGLAWRLHPLREELNAALIRLEDLRGRYPDPAGWKLASAERGERRREVHGRLLTLERLGAELGEFHAELGRDGPRLAADPRLPPHAGTRLKRGMADMERMGRAMRELAERARTGLTDDDAAFAAGERAERERRRGGIVFLGLLAALGGTVAAALRYRRQWLRLSTERATPGPAGERTPITAQADPAPGTPPLLPAPAPPSAPAAVEPGPGTMLQGVYRIERELGRGGMGVVYEAFDTALERKVAVKRMRREIREVARDYELFLKEARLVASLRHPAVVEIHAIVQEGGELYLVFELVEGETLRQILNRSPGYRLALPWVKRTVAQVAAALDYAHAQRVIHRDLKPSNIMLTRAGEARVMDFGIAHRAKLTVAKQTHTQAWGTPPYMAPEQELGTVSRESDVFSLGVCVYEMLTGRVPYEGPNYLAQKTGMIYRPPAGVVAGVPPAADALIARALQAEPVRRFRSARELAAAVQAL